MKGPRYSSRLREVNLELGMPFADQAIKRLTFEIHHSRAMGCTVLKIIHGYGSSGKGGKIRTESRKYLTRLKRQGEIRDFVKGEQFSIFEEATRQAFARCEERDHAVVEADLTTWNRNLYGAVHGGMFLTMADCAAGGAARSNGMRYVTISNSFEFFRNTKRDHLIAEGRVKSRGTTLCVVEVEIRDETEKLLCGGTFTMFCVGKQDCISAE